LEPPLITCEPVLAEVSFLLARGRSTAAWPIEIHERGIVQNGQHLEDEAK
jgi:hypothetical protein